MPGMNDLGGEEGGYPAAAAASASTTIINFNTLFLFLPPPDGAMRVGCGPRGFGPTVEVAWEEREGDTDEDDASGEEHEEREERDEEGAGWRAVEGQ